MMFIIRCSARAFCMAIRLSPSSTNSGTRMSMAKKSWNSGGGVGLRNLRHTDTGARKPNGTRVSSRGAATISAIRPFSTLSA